MEWLFFSPIGLYIVLVIMGLYCVLLFGWQIKVLMGKSMPNPDGSIDDWHKQKTLYGIAFADVYLSCPANFAGIVLIFITPRWGYYLLALVSFWWMWSNLMSTATSLRFESPKITLNWFFTYPFGILVGLFYIIWTVINFDAIYFQRSTVI